MSVLRDVESVAAVVEQIASDVSLLAPPPVGTVASALALGSKAVEAVLVAIDGGMSEDEAVAAIEAAIKAKARAELSTEET